MRYHFPHDSQAHLRRALFHVLNAPWKRVNDREPTDEVLLQFTTRNGKLYQCSFAKAEGRCVKEFDRKDRVLDHIRTHIDLQPFVCRDAGWYVPFFLSPLRPLSVVFFLTCILYPAINGFAPNQTCYSMRRTRRRLSVINGQSLRVASSTVACCHRRGLTSNSQWSKNTSKKSSEAQGDKSLSCRSCRCYSDELHGGFSMKRPGREG